MADNRVASGGERDESANELQKTKEQTSTSITTLREIELGKG